MPQVPPESAQGPSPATQFAPAERATAEAVRQAAEAVSTSRIMSATLQGVGGILLVLNPQRQIVAVNDQLLRLLGCEEPETLLGMRPGEALHCIHAQENPGGGCGTGPFCHTCGAAVAIVSSQRDNAPAEAECLLTASAGGKQQAFEFRVRATPVVMSGQALTVISLQDISDLKRREALEAVFLHDLMNTASALQYAVQALAGCDERDREGLLRDIADLTHRVVAEIAEQRDLADLEAGRFRVRLAYTSPSEVFEVLQHVFAHHGCAEDKRLVFRCEGDDLLVRTDSILLVRALGNLVKNALEATPAGGEVRVACRAEGGHVVFEVWNAKVMPRDVALQMFVRYFSTKGRKGRGLGTYGAKLIVERHLGGHISFTSAEGQGTTFRLELPREAEEPAAE